MNSAIGIDLGGTNLKSGILLQNGELLHRSYAPAEADKGPAKVIQNIISSIDQLLDKQEASDLVGIGIGSPGQVDFESGIVKEPPNLTGWHSEKLGEIIYKQFGKSTFVDNDANVAALAASVFGAGKKSKYFALITLGTGVGGGIILNNKIYHGVSGCAGEFGHICIKYDGPRCKCGQLGCIERYIGAQWIVERAISYLPDYQDSELNMYKKNQSLSVKIISTFANNGDSLCKRVIEETGSYLGIAIGTLVNLLNLDLILVGGGISNAGPILFKTIRKSFKKYSLPVSGSVVKIEKTSLGEHAGIVGAGQLVFENLAQSE